MEVQQHRLVLKTLPTKIFYVFVLLFLEAGSALHLLSGYHYCIDDVQLKLEPNVSSKRKI